MSEQQPTADELIAIAVLYPDLHGMRDANRVPDEVRKVLEFAIGDWTDDHDQPYMTLESLPVGVLDRCTHKLCGIAFDEIEAALEAVDGGEWDDWQQHLDHSRKMGD